jgi:large repetitive protein
MRRTGVALALAAAVLALAATPALAANPTAVLDVPSTVSFGAAVPLDGHRSFDPDAGDSVKEYRWTVDSRATVVTSASSFNAPAGTPPLTLGRHTATLVVGDTSGNVSTAASAAFVVIDDVAPTAVLDAPSSVAFGASVPLDGSRSFDPAPGHVVEYRWTVDARAVVVTSDPTFNAPAGSPALAIGQHTAKLVVVDDSGNQSTQVSRTFIVRDTVNPTAVLDAPATVTITSALALSGARSTDVGGSVVEYRWTVGARPVVVTSDPTFNAPAGLPPGRITVSLAVVDDSGNVSSPTAVSVVVLDNVAPTAVLDAPGSVADGDRIPLSGARSSDVGGRVVQYTWKIDGGAPVVTSDPTFSAAPQAHGTHTISLSVRDDAGNDSAPVAVTVFVGDDIAPTAVLDAPATVRVGASIPLSGARSTDVRGRVIRYTWTIDGGSPVATTDPSFTAAALPLGRHTVALVVTDDAGNQSAADARAVVVIDDLAPTAVLDAPATATAGAAIPLSGARSFDAGGRVVRFRWTVDGRAPVETTGATFSAPGLAAGRHTVSLVVTDDSGNQSAADVRTVDVAAPPVTPAQPKPPSGTKLTTFGKLTLIAPKGKKTAQIDLRKGTLIAGRLFSPVKTTLIARFSAGKLALGTAKVKLKAGGVGRLQVSLSKRVRKALKGKKRLKVTVKAGGVTRRLTVPVK